MNSRPVEGLHALLQPEWHSPCNHIYHEVPMLNGLFTTYSGKFVNARRLEIISNNLANVSTAGFKASRPVFNSITNEEIMVADQLENTYTSVYDSYLNFEGGMPVETGSELDFAIEGDGFFVISTKEGLRYTRNGKFTIDHEKRLVTAGGDPVLGRGGEITVDGKQVSVENDGTISVDNTAVDVLKVVDFKNRSAVRSAGKNLLVNTDEKNEELAPDNFTVTQGRYEASNVNVVREMIEMMYAVRAYEAYAKVDQYFDDILGKLIEVGKL